ncbi:hypothetical protein AGMMS4956_20380 [Bacteroidia bacterium]|nr:hypothetical protein AGMMS4956_20380 [Bacteroidia bacterium]
MGVIIRQSIKGTIVTYAGAFLGFVTTMFVITKYLTPEDVGLTRVLLEIGMLFSGLSMLGTSASMFRFFPYFKDKSKNHNGFFFYIVCIPFIGCLLFVAVYLIARQPITAFFVTKSALLIDYYYWVIPLFVVMAFRTIFENYSNINMRIVVPRINSEVILRLLIMAVYLLFGWHFVGRGGMVIGLVIAYGATMLIALGYVAATNSVSLRHDVSFVSPALRKDIVRYTLFLIVGTLSGALISKIDLFMVSSQLGLESAGIFTIAFFIASITEIPSRSISSIASPIAAEALKNGDFTTANQLYQKVALHQLMAGGFIFLVVWINIDNIFAIIPNGSVYVAGKWVVLFIGLARLVSVTLGFGGTMISFSKYYYWSLYFTLILTTIGIATNLWLIPILGITGAAIATLLTCLLSYLIQQWIVLKKIKGNPYTVNLFKLMGILLVVWGINFFLVKLSNPWIDGIYRTFIITVVCAVLFYVFNISDDLRNTIRVILKRVKKIISL